MQVPVRGCSYLSPIQARYERRLHRGVSDKLILLDHSGRLSSRSSARRAFLRSRYRRARSAGLEWLTKPVDCPVCNNHVHFGNAIGRFRPKAEVRHTTATSALYYGRNWCDVYSLHERHIRRYLPMETTKCMILGTDFANHPNFSDARSKAKICLIISTSLHQ